MKKYIKYFIEWLIYYILIMIYIQFAFIWKRESVTDNVFIGGTILYLFLLIELHYLKRKIKYGKYLERTRGKI